MEIRVVLFKQQKLLFKPHYQRGPQSLTSQLDLPQGKRECVKTLYFVLNPMIVYGYTN